MKDMNLKSTLVNAINTNRKVIFGHPRMAVFATAQADVTFVALNEYGGAVNPYTYNTGKMIGFSGDTNEMLVSNFGLAFKL